MMYFLIGAARSGTSYLGGLVSKSDSVVYYEEPNPIWRFSNAYSSHDVLTREDAKPRAKKFIRSYFNDGRARHAGKVILEKTPTNCLRLPFIDEIFPEAKYIFLHRDREEVAYSALKKWENEEDNNSVRLPEAQKVSHMDRQMTIQREKFKMIHWSDLPAYAPTIFSEIMFRKFGRKRSVWGPRFPGIKDYSKKISPIELCRLQWEHCNFHINQFKGSLPIDRYIEVEYKDLSSSESRRKELARINRFMGI